MTILTLVILLMNGSTSAQDFLPPDAKLAKLAGGMKFIEGPVWSDEDGGFLIFSDIPADELKKWSAQDGATTFRKPSHNANGNTRDRDGKLFTCEHTTRCVTRTKKDAIYTLFNSYDGKKFNSPNDIVVKSDDSIWFTDPPYGTPKDQKRELDKQYVFRFDINKDGLIPVVDDFDMPNGLCFSPDEKKLYIADSGKPHHIRVFDVQPDNTLTNGKVFCVIDNGVPDGIRCDKQARVWSSAGDGVHIFAADGKLIGKISVPESPANLCFGGKDQDTLFITARTSLYTIKIK